MSKLSIIAKMLEGHVDSDTMTMAKNINIVEKVANNKKVDSQTQSVISPKLTESQIQSIASSVTMSQPQQFAPQPTQQVRQPLYEAPERYPEYTPTTTYNTMTGGSSEAISEDAIQALMRGEKPLTKAPAPTQQFTDYSKMVSQPAQQPIYEQVQYQQPMMLNEQTVHMLLPYLIPHLKEMIKDETMNTILFEMFSKDRIKKVIKEILEERKK